MISPVTTCRNAITGKRLKGVYLYELKLAYKHQRTNITTEMCNTYNQEAHEIIDELDK